MPPKGSRPHGSTKPAHLLGYLDDVPCYGLEVDEIEPKSIPGEARFFGLRELYGLVPDEYYSVAGYAAQIMAWQRASRFCPSCGSIWLQNDGEWGKHCDVCQHGAYPPVSPCVIGLVHHGDRILMTHKAGWGPRYGLVAGFVEPGETLEHCLMREVREETGVLIQNPHYVASQPWPFPHQLMCGFFAEFAGGHIQVDGKELDDAKWFTAKDVRTGNPTIPPPLSIARQLIDSWLALQP